MKSFLKEKVRLLKKLTLFKYSAFMAKIQKFVSTNPKTFSRLLLIKFVITFTIT